MNGIIIVLLMPFLFGCIQGRVANITVIIKAPVNVCGDQLMSALYALCDGKFHSAPIGDNSIGKSKRSLRHIGIADECCNSPCNLEHMSKYCQENPSYRNMVALHGQIARDKSKEKQFSSAVLDNEVSKKGNGKGRRERANRKTKKPVIVECMYRSFAHYLLKHPKTLQRHRRGRVGDIKKDPTPVPDHQQEGTATQHKLGGGKGNPKYSISSP